MLSRRITIQLIDPLVLSQHGATTGNHECLSYIPGANLLGLAARAYAEFTPQEQWLVFHSGKVRFGDARIVGTAGCETVPMPFAFHSLKGESKTKELDNKRNQLDAENICNLSVMTRKQLLDAGKQPKQLRDDYVTAAAEVIKVALDGSLKTAIDPEQGRAQTGQLFGYQSLCAGQQFAGYLHADDDVPENLLEKLCRLLMTSPRLGRSRSAQFGRVAVTVSMQAPQWVSSCLANPSDKVILLATSDLALCDDHGLPLLVPDAAALGLSHLELDTEATHLRTRTYSPYNQWRRSCDAERQVIMAGSVITFRTLPGFNAATLQTLAQGVGQYREAGLGQLLVNPELLSGENVTASAWPAMAAPTAASVKKPVTPLMQWLERQQRGDVAATKGIVRELAGDLKTLYRTARLYIGAVVGVPVGPGRTQWGRVSDVAKLPGMNANRLIDKLFNEDSRICKGADWDTLGFPGEQSESFGSWLKGVIEKHANRDDIIEVVRQLAREAQSTEITHARLGKLER